MFRRLRVPVLIVLLLVVTSAVFAQVRGFSFLEYDDPDYVTANPVVRRGLSWEGVRWAFATFHAGNWHPLTWLSHMTDSTLFGLDPAGHHLHNLLLHLLTGSALFLLLLALTGAPWPSWLVAALFAVHPLHVEPVVWVAERKELLSAFLGGVALAAWLRYARRPARGRYLLVGLLLALALMAKPMAVTLPALLLLLDLWPLGRLRVRTLAALIAEKVPLLALSAIAAVLTFLAQDDVGALQPNARLSLVARAANAVSAPFVYLRQALYPAELNLFYPHRGEAFSIAALAVGLFAIGGVTAAAAEALRQFERALAIDPGNWRAHANRAAALRRLGRTAEALEEYRAVLRLRPGYPPALEALAPPPPL